MALSIPRILIAGANSGVGKTSVSLAIVRALRKRGLSVQTFKVGPDYLDPTYLSIASGKPCYNLDGWMAGQDYVADLFARAASGADIAVIEGVMGLFDGADSDSLEGSAAEIAIRLNAPVVLVVNVHGVARSLAAIVKGFTEFEPDVRVAGVISNHCGSDRHAARLAEALAFSGLPPQVGALPRGAFPVIPSRHLGLVTAAQDTLALDILDALAEAGERYLAVDELLKIARAAPPLPEPAPTPEIIAYPKVRIGLASDAAFHFYYPDNLEALERNGCEIVRFSPVTDSALPEDLDGLYLGGGYPEEYAEALAANGSMLREVREFAATGRPVYGECGGLMYLSQGIETLDGKRHDLVGLLPARTRMLDRLKSLGYVEATPAGESLFGPEGTLLRGHEFHYSELVGDPAASPEWVPAYRVRHRRSGDTEYEGFQCGNILASYVHMHLASRPEAIRAFTDRCRCGKRV